MLRSLKIKDFALIESLELEFQSNFIALTGETGSGKSLILDALTSVLGGKCNTMNIRTGAKKYQIEAIFDISDSLKAQQWLKEKQIEFENDELILRKELNAEGKSRIQINSALAPSQYLKEVGSFLAEVHRQNEQSQLLEKDKQLDYLDTFLHLTVERKELKTAFLSYKSLNNHLKELEESEHEKERKIELYKFQLEEIQNANLKESEEKDLLFEEKQLLQGEKLTENLNRMLDVLSNSEESILKNFSRLQFASNKLETLNPEFKTLNLEIEEMHERLKEIQTKIYDETDGVFYSYERLENVQSRLDLIAKLKKKYNKDISELLALAERLESDLDVLFSSQERIESIRLERNKALSHLTKLALQISSKRREGIAKIETEMTKQLESLGMNGAKLQIVMRWESSPDGELEENGKKYFVNETGLDQIDFYFTANTGEKPRPIRKIASGGEISRIMLGLKTILGDGESRRLMIFDEIDSGIGGEIAQRVAQKLKSSSLHHQIFLITHQQSIAAQSDEQFLVEKQLFNNRTVSTAQLLSGKTRALELAKMISGENFTKAALEHAKELLKKAG
ncbi:MAG: DNA repair protein RecN [Leptospiraceae bacterium]|nr:DNA repair protein RecN [Leptospiraceae bacterium]